MSDITTDRVYLSDGRGNNVLVSSVDRVLTTNEIRARNAAQRLISTRARLQQIRDQANTASTGGAFANLAAASTAIRQIANGIADLAQNILDLEFIAAYQQDNGVD